MRGTASVLDGPPVPGFYGKLPTRGDFLSRGLPRGFTDTWDRWLQDVMQAVPAEAWPAPDPPATTLSPRQTDRLSACRFALTPGVCGPSAALGAMLPSLDRVGRRFPLTAVLPLSQTCGLASVPAALTTWFDALEGLLQAALTGVLDADALEEELADFDTPVLPDPAPIAPLSTGAQVLIPPGHSLEAGFPLLLDALVLDGTSAAYSLWWSGPASNGAARLVLARGLPAPAPIVDLLTWQGLP